jgi:WD40 repeat protein
VRFTHPGWQRAQNAFVQQSPDGRFAVTWLDGAGGDERLWRLPRAHSRPPLPPAEAAHLPERASDYHFGRFDPRGTGAVLWWLRRSEENHQLRFVDVATGAARATSVRHASVIREVAFSPDGRYFATGSDDSTCRVWEAATGRPAGPPLPHPNFVSAVEFCPDGATLAAGDFGPPGLVKLWDWRTGQEARPPLRHDDILVTVSFSPDGRHQAVLKADDWSRNPELVVWEVASGTAVFRMPHRYASFLLGTNMAAHASQKIHFRPDGRAIVVRERNGVLRLLEVPSGKLLGQRSLDGPGVARFSPDGRVVAAAANLGVRLLDGDTLAPLDAGYLPHADPITDITFSPDGASLLTAQESGSAQLWDVATRKPVGPPAVLVGPLRAVAFTPDGTTCLCLAADGTVRRWPVPTPFVEPDLDRLDDRVALLTGQRIGDDHSLDSMPAEEWRALRAKLVGDGSTALDPPRPDADWHDAVAADAEQDGDTYGAEWHLDRLAALRPNDWTIPARLGRILAATGDKEKAAAAYDRAARLARTPRELADWLRAAAAEDEAARRYDQGVWNLDRAVKLTPQDLVPYAARATVLDKAGHMDRAAADVDATVRLGAEATTIVQAVDRAVPRATKPADWVRLATLLATAAKDATLPIADRYHLALACLKAGDRAGYQAACAGIAGRLAPAGTMPPLGDALESAKAFTSGPAATADWAVPLSAVDRILTRMAEREAAEPGYKERVKPLRQVYVHLRGALLYRAGRLEEAATAFADPAALHELDREFANRVFVALIEHARGRADEARAAAARARAARPTLKDDKAWDRAEVELLAAELDAALPPAGK